MSVFQALSAGKTCRLLRFADSTAVVGPAEVELMLPFALLPALLVPALPVAPLLRVPPELSVLVAEFGQPPASSPNRPVPIAQETPQRMPVLSLHILILFNSPAAKAISNCGQFAQQGCQITSSGTISPAAVLPDRPTKSLILNEGLLILHGG